MIKMISEISKGSVQGIDIFSEAESADDITADTALRWTSERICHSRH
jgi:hypothetical protein